MAHSSQSSNAVNEMLRNLVEADALGVRLAATAPLTMEKNGGAASLVAAKGHPTGAWFWAIQPMPGAVWVRMAEEHQTSHRTSLGDA